MHHAAARSAILDAYAALIAEADAAEAEPVLPDVPTPRPGTRLGPGRTITDPEAWRRGCRVRLLNGGAQARAAMDEIMNLTT